MSCGTAIQQLVSLVRQTQNINDKQIMTDILEKGLHLLKKGKIYYRPGEFAVRVITSKGNNPGNTVTSIQNILDFNDIPFFVLIVCKEKANQLLLANATIDRKVSHSSKNFTCDNIRGSINCSDIMREVDGIPNEPASFEKLFELHKSVPKEENIRRLVEATAGIRTISGRTTSFTKEKLARAVSDAETFAGSRYMRKLRRKLASRIRDVREEILLAARIENTNIRGKCIEYMISGDDEKVRRQLIRALRNGETLPNLFTRNDLGDMSCRYGRYNVAIDIKSDMLWLDGNPKGCSVDKLIEFLSEDGTVYLFLFVGCDREGHVYEELCSIFDGRLAHSHVVEHWSGRNALGHIQLSGADIKEILCGMSPDGGPAGYTPDILAKCLGKLPGT